MPQVLTQENFDSTVLKNEIVLVDFWAQWCVPCLSFREIFHAVSKDFPSILFAEVDIEAEPELAKDFNIRSVPMLMVFKSNIAIYAESGFLTAEQLISLVKDAVNLDISDLQEQIALVEGQK